MHRTFDIDHVAALPGGRRSYLLEELAPHLFNSHETERLAMLFHSSAWRDARFRYAGDTYEGYVRDLDLAWERAHEYADSQIEAGQVPTRIADCFRYAVIRTSVNRLAASYVAPLIARAVETGLWSVERALLMAKRCPDPVRQAEIYAAILGTRLVSSPEIADTQQLMLAAALTPQTEGVHIRLLVPLMLIAPQLPAQLSERQVAAVLSVRDPFLKAFVITELFPRIPQMFHTRVLDALFDLPDPEMLTHLLEQLTPLLPDALVPRVWSYSCDQLIGSRTRPRIYAMVRGTITRLPNPWPTLLELVAPRLDSAQLQTTVAQISALRDSWERAKAFVVIFPFLSDDQQARYADSIIAAIVEVMAEEDQQLADQQPAVLDPAALVGASPEESANMVMRMPSNLTSEDVRGHFTMLTAFSTPAGRQAERLSFTDDTPALPAHLEGVVVSPEQVFEFGGSQPPLTGMKRHALPTDKAANLFADLALHLPQPLVYQVLKLTQDQPLRQFHIVAAILEQRSDVPLINQVSYALAFRHDSVRAYLLARLPGHLPQAEIDRAIAAIAELTKPDLAGATLSAFLSRLPARCATYVVDRLALIDDRPKYAYFLTILLPYLKEQRPLVEQLLDITPALSAREQAYVLAHVAPACPDDLIDRLQELVHRVKDDQRRSQLLVEVAPHCRAPLLGALLDEIPYVTDPKERAKACIGMAPHLAGQQRESALTWALDAIDALPPSTDTLELNNQAAALFKLGPLLTGAWLDRALDAALRLLNERERDPVLAMLASRCDRNQAQRMVAASSAVANDARAEALAGMTPRLTGEHQRQAIIHCLQAISAMTFQQEQSRLLQQIAAYLPEDMQAQALEIAEALFYERDRLPALRALAPHLTPALAQPLLDAVVKMRDNDLCRADMIAVLTPRLATSPRSLVDRWRDRFSPTPRSATSLLRQAYRAAAEMKDSYARATLVTAIVPMAPPAQRIQMQEEALALTLGVQAAAARVQGLIKLMPQLEGRARTIALSQACESIEQIAPVEHRIHALLQIVSYVGPAQQQHMFDAIVNTAVAIENDAEQERVIAAIAAPLPLPHKIVLLHVIAAKLHSLARLQMLISIAAQLDGEQRLEVLNHVLDVIFAQRRTSEFERVLCRVIPLLPLHECFLCLAKLLEVADTYPLRALAAFLPLIDNKPLIINETPAHILIRAGQRRFVIGLLQAYKNKSRAEVLKLCLDADLFCELLLSTQVLNAIAAHIIEICHEWDWTH